MQRKKLLCRAFALFLVLILLGVPLLGGCGADGGPDIQASRVRFGEVVANKITIIGGDLKVGDADPTTALDGEDLYVEGTLEADGTARFDGTVDANSTMDVAGNLSSATGAFTINDDLAWTAGKKAYPTGATNASVPFACVGSHDHSSAESAVTICILPANVDIIEVSYVVHTDWNDGTSAAVDCGISGGDTDAYVDALDLNGTGDNTINRMGDGADMPVGTSFGDVGGSNVTVVCQVAEGSDDASEGSATLVITYVVR